MEIIFHSHANKTNFYKKGCALGIILKVTVFRTRKWPIGHALLSLAVSLSDIKTLSRDSLIAFSL